jgi:hypothetical protein
MAERRAASALSSLALLLPACAGDLLPTQPDAPPSAAQVNAVLAKLPAELVDHQGQHADGPSWPGDVHGRRHRLRHRRPERQ